MHLIPSTYNLKEAVAFAYEAIFYCDQAICTGFGKKEIQKGCRHNQQAQWKGRDRESDKFDRGMKDCLLLAQVLLSTLIRNLLLLVFHKTSS